MLSLFNPYEQFSIYPRDDYGDHGGLLSHALSARSPEEAEARRKHPSAQPVDESQRQSNELRTRLAS
jgi:hypothetical protein